DQLLNPSAPGRVRALAVAVQVDAERTALALRLLEEQPWHKNARLRLEDEFADLQSVPLYHLDFFPRRFRQRSLQAEQPFDLFQEIVAGSARALGRQLTAGLRIEVERGFALELLKHLTRACAEQLSVLDDGEFAFNWCVVHLQQPAAHPAQRRL